MVVVPNKHEEASQLTIVANSVSHLAKLVSDLQSQLKQLDARLSSQETESLANYNRRKRDDFKDAYKGLVSIIRTLKNSPEIQEAAHKVHEHSSGTNSTSDVLRKIAATLNDVDTVASCVSNDDLSLRGGVPQAVQFSSHDVDEMRRLLQDKERQMEQLRKENDERLAKLEKELQKRNKASVWKQFFPVVLVLGSFGIANKEVINPTNLFTSNPVENLNHIKNGHYDTMSHINDVLNSKPLAAPEQHELVSSDTNQDKKTVSTILYNSISNDDEESETVDATRFEPPAVNYHFSPHDTFDETLEKLETANQIILESKVTTTIDTSKCWSNIASKWLKSNLCQELSEMIECKEEISQSLMSTPRRIMMPSQLVSAILMASIIPFTLVRVLFTPVLFSSNFWVSSLHYLSKLVQ